MRLKVHPMIWTPNAPLKLRSLNYEWVLLGCGSVAGGALCLWGKRRRLWVTIQYHTVIFIWIRKIYGRKKLETIILWEFLSHRLRTPSMIIQLFIFFHRHFHVFIIFFNTACFRCFFLFFPFFFSSGEVPILPQEQPKCWKNWKKLEQTS